MMARKNDPPAAEKFFLLPELIRRSPPQADEGGQESALTTE